MTEQNPAAAVVTSVDQCLDLAATWHAWDGRPIARTIDGLPSTWAPHKAIRRITDHLIDHLHEVEALLAEADPGCADWPGATCCATRWRGPRPGTRRVAKPGHCARSPSTWPM